MKGEWILKEVYFEDGWPSVIRDPVRPVQVPVAEFVEMVMEKEHLTIDKAVEAERDACRLIVLDNSDAEGICCTDDVIEAFRQRGDK